MRVQDQIEACLFDRRGRSPYYVMAPGYTETSAGVRALYVLAHALNGAGEEAYVVTPKASPIPLDHVAGLRTPFLTAASAEMHHQLGRTPVVVTPETFDPVTGDVVQAVYLLNYAGQLDGPMTFPGADVLVAYSHAIARRTPGCALTIHIPVVDAGYWTPDPGLDSTRRGVAAYAGKYVDHHLQALPADLADARVIPRWGGDAPGREEMREIFRSATALHIFENTAAAIEAALCGCPVVCRFNPYFDELISAEETGLAGFALDQTPAALAEAQSTVTYFRQDYARAGQRFGAALLSFIDATQALARTRVYARPFASSVDL